MSGALVSVAVVDTRTEADLIVGLLRANGLRAGVAADDAGGTNPELQLQGVRVLVDPADEEVVQTCSQVLDGVRLELETDRLCLQEFRIDPSVLKLADLSSPQVPNVLAAAFDMAESSVVSGRPGRAGPRDGRRPIRRGSRRGAR